MTPGLTAILVIAAAYLLGSLSGSLLLGRLRGIDIREQGSGNAGGTNALRTQGWKFAVGTVLIDVGKGAAVVALARLVGSAPALVYAAGFAAMLGHVWPVFHGFRGGKGGGTLVGVLLMAWPVAVAVLIAVWALVMVIGGYVGLSTIVAAAALVPLALLTGGGDERLWFAALAALFILFTHRANLARLRAGTESRFERARLFARRRGAA